MVDGKHLDIAQNRVGDSTTALPARSDHINPVAGKEKTGDTDDVIDAYRYGSHVLVNKRSKSAAFTLFNKAHFHQDFPGYDWLRGDLVDHFFLQRERPGWYRIFRHLDDLQVTFLHLGTKGNCHGRRDNSRYVGFFLVRLIRYPPAGHHRSAQAQHER